MYSRSAYANTAFLLRKTELPEIRRAVQLNVAQRLGIDLDSLDFTPDSILLRLPDERRLTLRGDKLSRASGYFSLEEHWVTDGVARTLLWRVAQSPEFDSAVEVHLTGTVNADPSYEQRQHWHFVRDLLVDWQKRFLIRDLRNEPMPAKEKVKSTHQVERLVARAMDPERRHALVLISPTNHDNYYPVDHHTLAEWLAGYATVVRVERGATHHLTNALGGEDYSCFNGSLRILQPDYQERHRAVYNPLLRSQRLRDLVREGTLEDRLFQAIQVRGQQALRFVRPLPTYQRVNELLREQYDVLDQSDGPVLTELELRLALKDAQTVNAELRERLDALESRLADYESDAAPDRLRLDERITRYLAGNRHIRVWKTALSAAAAIDADHYVAQTVDKTLEALEAYAGALANEPTFHLGSDIYQFFKNRGVKFHYTDSPTTMGKYGAHRQFTEDDQTRTVKSHFTLNTNTTRCVQLYFDTDPERRVLNLVYAGKHLPTAEGTYNN